MRQLSAVMRIEDIAIATRWYELGLELVNSDRILKDIRTNHRNDVNVCCRLMFEKWLERTPDANWVKLIAALNDIGMKTAAEAVSKQFKAG